MEEDIANQQIQYSMNLMWVTLTYEEKRTNLNSYYKNIKLTLETSPKNLLRTEIIRTEPGIKTQVYNKAEKRPVHWPLRVLFKYKRNAIIGELERAKRIALDFDKEIEIIKIKYVHTGYPKYVTENTIKNFNSKNVELIIPPWLFNKRKRVRIRSPF